MKNDKNILHSWESTRADQGKSSDPTHRPWPQVWKGSDDLGSDFQPDIEAGLSRLKSRIAQDEQPSGRVVSIAHRRWLRVAAAVGALVLVALGISRYQNADPAGFAWLEVQTNEGEIREVLLPDGSTVALNENTFLSYRSDLNDADVRDIRLEGEAFFDVNRREEQPFIIRTANTEVQVLGTSFKVSELPGESRTAVEVSTGKVAVRHLKENSETIYLTATQAVLVEESGYTTYTVDDQVFEGNIWRKTNARLNFKNTALETVLLEVEEAYKVDFIWDTNAVRNCPITINWAEEEFANVLDYLKNLGVDINAIDDKTYRLSGSCQ